MIFGNNSVYASAISDLRQIDISGMLICVRTRNELF